MHSVLVTGSGCPGWYSVFKLLKRWEEDAWENLRIFGCDSNPNPSGGNLPEKNFYVPNGDEPGYIKRVLQVVEENKIEAILPLTDPELLPLAQAAAAFETIGCEILCSKKEMLGLVLDKANLYKRFPGISPRFRFLEEIGEVKAFIEDSSDGRSCFVKLAKAYGSRGVKKVMGDKEWLSGFRSEKPEPFGLTFPLSLLSALDPKPREFMLVETLPGAEYSIDCVFDGYGDFRFWGVREREMTRGGITHTAKFVPDSGEFREFLDPLARELQLKHIVNVQAKRDINGKLKLLEINPRVPGSVGTWQTVGYNLVGMMFDGHWDKDCRRGGGTPGEYDTSHAYRVSHFI